MSIQLQRNKMWNSPQARRPTQERTNQSKKLSATMFLLKVRPLKKHLEELQVVLKTFESLPTVIFLVETWIKDGNYEYHFLLDGYKSIITKTQRRKEEDSPFFAKKVLKLSTNF